MDEGRFKDAVEFAKAHRGQADAGRAGILAERYRRASADERPKLLARLLKDSAANRSDWDAVKLIARRLHRDRELLPPAELDEWVDDVLDGRLERPKRRGPDPGGNLVRDELIVRLVKLFESDGFTATRNKTKAGVDSACDAVGEAFGMSYGAVEKVWTLHRRLERTMQEPWWPPRPAGLVRHEPENK